jgi:hypothetical protein
MPGKIYDAKPLIAAAQKRAQALNEFKIKCRHLTFSSVTPANLKNVIEFLRYQKGNGNFVQDMKALVIRRLACEALSLSHLEMHRRFDELLNDFPPPPLMRGFMIPKKHELGEAQEIIETCRPAPGDTNVVLRAKQEGLLFNLTLLIQETFTIYGNRATSKFKKKDFINLFSWIWEMLREFTPYMPRELAELVKIHVFDPPLPFDIELPQ